MRERDATWRAGRTGGIAFEVTGPTEPADAAPVVLVAGADTPGAGWPPELVSALTGAGRVVVRFDHREVGDSAGDWPDYDLTDMVDDTVAVIGAATGRSRAHLIGSSLGGMVAQLAAIDDRACSLTLIATSPGPAAGVSPPDDTYLGSLAELAFADGITEAEIARRSAEALSGDRYRFVSPRDLGPGPATRHALAVERTPPWHGRLRGLNVPTLVIHGTVDPLFPLDHAERLAELVPGASLLAVEGLGHEIPGDLFSEFGGRIVEHLEAADRGR